jgi:signal transduction histidine kinase/ActR/RegA family two-component response regulator
MKLTPSRRIFLAFACLILLLAAQGAATVLSLRFTLAEIQRLDKARDDAQMLVNLLNRVQTDVAILTGSRNPAVMDRYLDNFRADWGQMQVLVGSLKREVASAPGPDLAVLDDLKHAYEQTISFQYHFAFEMAQQSLAGTVPLYQTAAARVARSLDTAEQQKTASLARLGTRALAQAALLGLLAIAIALYWAWYLQRIFTDRKRAEAALAAALRRLETVLDAAGQVAIIMTDPQGLVQVFNRGAQELTGWPAEAVVGRESCLLWHDPEEIERRRQDLADVGIAMADPFQVLIQPALIGQAVRRRWTVVTHQGQRRVMDLVVTRVDDPQGGCMGFLGIGIDITMQEEAAAALGRKEEELKHSQKMEAIGQLAGGIAHDFNNMLAGIMNSAELLAESMPADDPRIKMVQLIVRASQRAGELTSKLLSFSRRGKLVSTPFSVHRAIQETLMLAQRSFDPRITIRQELMAGEPMVVGDPSEMENALLNLCLNARDAMPGGGILTVRTEVREREGAPMLCIQVADTGTGIPAAVQEHIFEPYFTTKPQGKGTGMGLAAVYGIVQAHHGFLDLESALGQGTTFRIHLPLDFGVAPIEPASHAPVAAGNGTVLVVDDEELVRTTASLLLQSAGYEVILAGSGEEGLRLYQLHRGRIRLVLLDLIMPGSSGRDTFLRLRAMDPSARVLFNSGFVAESGIPDLVAAGSCGFLRKPYSRGALLEAVVKALGEPVAGG